MDETKTCMCVLVCVCVYMCVCVCMSVRYVHVCVCMCMHVCVWVFLCACVYMCVQIRLSFLKQYVNCRKHEKSPVCCDKKPTSHEPHESVCKYIVQSHTQNFQKLIPKY